MRLPVPSPREVRATFTVAAVCVLALVATICWGIVHKVNQSDQIVRVATSQADQVERLNHQLDAQDKAAVQQRADLNDQIEILQRQNHALQGQLTGIAKYLRAHGIDIPRTAYRTSGGGSSGSSTRPKRPNGITGLLTAPPAPGKSGTHRNPHTLGKPHHRRH